MEIDLTQRPSALRYPTRFNPAAIELWFKSCQNLPSDIRSAWVAAVDIFKSLCDSAGLEPFSRTKDGNLAIRNYLSIRRHNFIRLLRTTRMMEGLPVLRPITRTVDHSGYGFKITVSCQVHIKDGDAFVKKIQHYPLKNRFGLMRDHHRRYHLKMDPGMTVFVYNDMINSPYRWHIGYEITCPINPEYHGVKDKTAFVLNYLWLPLAKQIRPRNVNQLRYI